MKQKNNESKAGDKINKEVKGRLIKFKMEDAVRNEIY